MGELTKKVKDTLTGAKEPDWKKETQRYKDQLEALQREKEKEG